MRHYFLLLLFLFAVSVKAQIVNEMPFTGLRKISWTPTFIESGNDYYFTRQEMGYKRPITNARPLSATIYKYNFKSRAVVKSAHIYGDTIQTDSVVDTYAQFIYSDGNQIFLAFNRSYPDDTLMQPHPYQSIMFMALDTALNVVVPEKRVKTKYLPHGRFASCHIQAFTMIGNHILIGYFQEDSVGGGMGALSRYLILDNAGNFIKDSIIGVVPNVQPSVEVRHRLAEIVPFGNNQALITGQGIADTGIHGPVSFAIADSNLNVLDTFYFKPALFFGSGGYQGYYLQPPNFQALPTGSIITGREYYLTSGPTPSSIYTAMSKLKASTRYTVDTTIVFPQFNAMDYEHNSNPSLHNLIYQQRDNRVYYASVNFQNFGFNGGCNGYPNFVQVMCTDTNLHTLWLKYLTPDSASCASITSVVKSDKRAGIDVVGQYVNTFSPLDTSLWGNFIYHIDSAGTLDVPSNHSYTLRDRLLIYPNPTTDAVVIDDLFKDINKVTVYDMQGRELARVIPVTYPVRMTLSAWPAGSYLVRVRLKDGSGVSKTVIRQ